MSDYIIFTDSCCDLSPQLLESWGVPYANMTFSFDGESQEYTNADISNADFYERMRQGAFAKTAAINSYAFCCAFEPHLQAGKDILYLAISSGLSTTINSAHLAAAELKESYPDRTIRIVDTMSASAGSGLLVYMAVNKKQSGSTMEETAVYIESLVPRQCIWFTVDDLEYLKRGGRISPLVAFAGGLLGIRPVLQMDDDGNLVKAFTVRGKAKAIEALAEKYAELACPGEDSPVFISHAAYESGAAQLAELLLQRHGVQVSQITEIGPVIGSHSGPGALAIFFLGTHR